MTWQLEKRRATARGARERSDVARTGKKLGDQKGGGTARHGNRRAGPHPGGQGWGDDVRGIGGVGGGELFPKRIDVLAARLLEEGVRIASVAGGVVQLGDELRIVMQFAPGEEGRAGAVGIVRGRRPDVDFRRVVFRLELNPTNVVGGRLDEPARRAARLDHVRHLVDG